jgi:hypothetical protein
MVWVQENTERDYSQREDGKNALVVVGDGDDGENSPAMLIQDSRERTTVGEGRSGLRG